MEPVGVEPTSSHLQSETLPLSYGSSVAVELFNVVVALRSLLEVNTLSLWSGRVLAVNAGQGVFLPPELDQMPEVTAALAPSMGA